jgi:hypothetical protein
LFATPILLREELLERFVVLVAASGSVVPGPIVTAPVEWQVARTASAEQGQMLLSALSMMSRTSRKGKQA